ncbi:MAG: CDP-2,3-bis-(O-geranylgeranyl)-sn-glycerol synthase [Halobacteriota archaeon]
MGPLEVVALAIWIMLPAYIPNNAAVLVGGGRPIDGGRDFRGARLLGDGKTWRGTLGGIAAGIVVALALTALVPTVADATGFDVPTFSPAATVTLPTGALLGDIGASFLKRRLGHERGSAVVGLDQYDLVIGSLGLTALVAWGWLAAVLTPWILVAIIVATPLLHLATNMIAYALGLKDVPW